MLMCRHIACTIRAQVHLFGRNLLGKRRLVGLATASAAAWKPQSPDPSALALALVLALDLALLSSSHLKSSTLRSSRHRASVPAVQLIYLLQYLYLRYFDHAYLLLILLLLTLDSGLWPFSGLCLADSIPKRALSKVD